MIYQLLYDKGSHCFDAPPFGGLRGNVDVHLRHIGKLLVDFLLVKIERFSYVLRLRRYERI